jgi:hypothetical protein
MAPGYSTRRLRGMSCSQTQRPFWSTKMNRVMGDAFCGALFRFVFSETCTYGCEPEHPQTRRIPMPD